jgi:hypothetical protein
MSHAHTAPAVLAANDAVQPRRRRIRECVSRSSRRKGEAAKHSSLVVAAAATVVAGMAGCSNTISTTGSSTTSSPVPSSSASPSSPTHSSAPSASPSAGSAQYKITINGQAITTAGNGVYCGNSPYAPEFDVDIGPPKYNGTYNTYANFFSITNETPPKLRSVLIQSDDGSIGYAWGAGAGQESPPSRGDAQLNKSDKTYKITGHIAPSYNNKTRQWYDSTAPLVPFEIDATCP